MEKDDQGVSSGGSLFFADRAGLELVLDDAAHTALHQFFPPSRGEGTSASDFVVLNGVSNSPSHQQWEIMHIESIRPTISSIRNVIDSVEPAATAAIPPTLSNPGLIDGAFTFQVDGSPGVETTVQVSRNGITWETRQTITLGDGPVTVTEPLLDGPEAVFYRLQIP